MAIRVVTEDAPIIRVTGAASAPVSSPIGAVNTVNVSQSNQIVKVPSTSVASIEIKPIGSAEVQVNNPIVRPFKAIIYQGPKGDPGEPGLSGDGSSFLTEDLTVTNPLGEILDNQIYPQLTDLEDIIVDILTKYDDPEVILTGVTFSNFLTDSDYIGNKIEFGSQLKVKRVVVESSSMENMVSGSVMTIKVTDPSNESSFLTLSPTLVMPTYGWEYFPQISVIETSHTQSLEYQTLGKKQVKIEYSYLEDPTNTFNATLGSFTYDFFIGKKIRCFTSLASDPRALNLASGFVDGVNVYDPSSENLLTDTLSVDGNEVQYEEILTDFESDDQEVIVSFSGDTQNVSDRERYLIIELPDEFKIDEAAAKTAGSGVYSLNNSIVYLGNQSSAGQYTRDNIPVKYYRSKIPGAFDNKIKLDLKIKLDN